eukprot:snap_masked-scaffold_6-processed-gene-18.20-mRNA-1 protein AED:1.00 eAED:1.00 QI:0/-1/0/0/-1/1/1/0/95
MSCKSEEPYIESIPGVQVANATMPNICANGYRSNTSWDKGAILDKRTLMNYWIPQIHHCFRLASAELWVSCTNYKVKTRHSFVLGELEKMVCTLF